MRQFETLKSATMSGITERHTVDNYSCVRSTATAVSKTPAIPGPYNKTMARIVAAYYQCLIQKKNYDREQQSWANAQNTLDSSA